jgi:hypothetical protein
MVRVDSVPLLIGKLPNLDLDALLSQQVNTYGPQFHPVPGLLGCVHPTMIRN